MDIEHGRFRKVLSLISSSPLALQKMEQSESPLGGVQGHRTHTPRHCCPEKRKPEGAFRGVESSCPKTQGKIHASGGAREVIVGYLKEGQETFLSPGSKGWGAGMLGKAHPQGPVALGLIEGGLWRLLAPTCPQH